jgi:hypothetical protein
MKYARMARAFDADYISSVATRVNLVHRARKSWALQRYIADRALTLDWTPYKRFELATETTEQLFQPSQILNGLRWAEVDLVHPSGL